MPTEFEKAIELYLQEQQNLARHEVKDKRRAYYDSTGKIVDMAMGPPWPDLPNDFVDITEEQWNHIDSLTTVKNGALVFFDFRARTVLQLQQSDTGEHVAVKDHMSLHLDLNEEYENVTRYTNNIG
jgi:hypothetical protein